MSGPYKVLPDSDASRAVSEIGRQTLTKNNIAQEVQETLERHGVDKMTSSAAARAAETLAQNGNQDLDKIAAELVGTTVADPNVAARQAQNAVTSLPKDTPVAEKNKTAVAAAKSAAEKAGVDGNAAEKKAQEMIDQGVPPEQAALAAVLAVAGPAVAQSGNASSYEIFGYLTATIKGLVTETYLSTEKRFVDGLAEHTYTNSLVLKTPSTLTVDCKNYLAKAKSDTSELIISNSNYLAGYTMRAISPRSVTGIALTGYGAGATTVRGGIGSLAATKSFYNVLDLYIAFVAFTEKANSVDNMSKVQFPKTKIGFWLNIFTGFK